MGHAVKNGIDVVLDTKKFKSLIKNKGLDSNSFWERMVKKHDIALQQKSFLNLVDNRVTWRLLYAWAVADTLGVDIKDLFVKVEVATAGRVADPATVRAAKRIRFQMVAPH